MDPLNYAGNIYITTENKSTFNNRSRVINQVVNWKIAAIRSPPRPWWYFRNATGASMVHRRANLCVYFALCVINKQLPAHMCNNWRDHLRPDINNGRNYSRYSILGWERRGVTKIPLFFHHTSAFWIFHGGCFYTGWSRCDAWYINNNGGVGIFFKCLTCVGFEDAPLWSSGV